MNDNIKKIIGAVTGLAVLALFFYEDIKGIFKPDTVSEDRAEILRRAREAKAIKADAKAIEEIDVLSETEKITEDLESNEFNESYKKPGNETIKENE